MAGKMQYQYGTNPKKYETYPSKIQTKKQKSVQEKSNDVKSSKTNIKKKEELKNARKRKRNAVMYIFIIFGIVFGIGYRNALLDENFRKVENLKAELSELKKENNQLQVAIESGLNLSNVEQIARDVLGMRKIDSTQKVFVNLPKREYIEPASEKVVIEEPTLWDKIVRIISNIW